MHAGYLSLAKTFSYNIHIIKYQNDKNSSFHFEEVENIHFYDRNEFDLSKILNLFYKLEPIAVHSSGWNDKLYYKASKIFWKTNVMIICGLDNQWLGNFKQRLLCLISSYTLKKRYTHLWIPGLLQYEYARKLGYKYSNILLNYYSADTEIFVKASREKREQFSRTFIFTGKLEQYKGILTLVEALNTVIPLMKEKGWRFIFIGDGSLKDYLFENLDIGQTLMHIPFMQQTELFKFCSNMPGVFVLPSNYDAWGVVVHEFALLGYSFLVSDAVGAKASFVREGYNGYVVEKENSSQLANALIQFMNNTDKENLIMGERSRMLSSSINSNIWAYLFHNAILKHTK